MLNDFLKTIQGSLGEQIEDAGVGPDKISGVTDVVTNTFKDGLMEKFSGGDLSSITNLLGKGGSNSPFAGSLTNNIVGNLISKLGLSKEISNAVAKIAVPFIIDKLSGFASEKGKTGKDGIGDLMGDLLKGSMKDKLLGGLGKKFGF